MFEPVVNCLLELSTHENISDQYDDHAMIRINLEMVVENALKQVWFEPNERYFQVFQRILLFHYLNFQHRQTSSRYVYSLYLKSDNHRRENESKMFLLYGNSK